MNGETLAAKPLACVVAAEASACSRMIMLNVAVKSGSQVVVTVGATDIALTSIGVAKIALHPKAAASSFYLFVLESHSITQVVAPNAVVIWAARSEALSKVGTSAVAAPIQPISFTWGVDAVSICRRKQSELLASALAVKHCSV